MSEVSSEAAESIVDVKSLIIGRESTTIGWATYESAVTESVYERSVAKDAQISTSVKSAGSGIQDEEQQGRAQINGRRSQHLAVRGSHGPWHSP